MKKEADVKKEIKRVLKAEGAWFYMPVQSGFGVAGIPDFIACIEGILYGIEAKFGNNTESAWQKIQGAGIQEAGGAYMVVNEKNIGDLSALIQAHKAIRA